MGFAHLVSTRATVEAFKAKYHIPQDVFIEYCQEGNIEDQKVLGVIFIPLMAIPEGGIRFLLDPLLLGTLRFYGLSLNQCLPNFYRIVDNVGWLNRLYNLNFLYNCSGSLKNGYYLKVQDTWIRLVSCLPNSNKNS